MTNPGLSLSMWNSTRRRVSMHTSYSVDSRIPRSSLVMARAHGDALGFRDAS
jgi:hypothetical protein